MLNASRIRDDRVAALLRFAAATRLVDAGVPAGIEDRIVAFAVGAAAAREKSRARRTRGWGMGLVALCAAAAVAAVVGLPWFSGETTPARPPVPPVTVANLAPESREEPRFESADSTIAVAVVASPDSRTRRAAIVHLRQSAAGVSPSAEVALARAALTDPNWRLRELALATYLQHPRKATDWVLSEALADPHIALRFAALAAITAVPEIGPATRQSLEARLAGDPDWRVRESALNLLLRAGAHDRAAALALRDSHRHLREIGERALANAVLLKAAP